MSTDATFLRIVDDRMRSVASGVAAALGTSTDEIGIRLGKRVRPRLVHACGEALQLDADRSAPWAAIVEMVHMASLVHDDVIDGAAFRRGRASIAARDGNRNAILAGDLLVSTAWLTAARDLPREATALLASAMIAMTTAELRERELLWNPDATLGTYLDVIDGKTAALFSAAAEGTAVLAGASAETRAALAGFGRCLGHAFQILDDVRDYAIPREVSGKDSLKDLAEGVATLPLLIALRSDNEHATAVRAYLASRGATPLDRSAVIALIESSGAVSRSLRIAKRRLAGGLRAIQGVLPGAGLRRVALASMGWNELSLGPWALSA